MLLLAVGGAGVQLRVEGERPAVLRVGADGGVNEALLNGNEEGAGRFNGCQGNRSGPRIKQSGTGTELMKITVKTLSPAGQRGSGGCPASERGCC